jgi:hypothetical protein
VGRKGATQPEMLLKKVFTGKERISLQFDIKVLSVLEIPSSKTNNNCGPSPFSILPASFDSGRTCFNMYFTHMNFIFVIGFDIFPVWDN